MKTANTVQVRHLEAIMRIAEAFCKMRLSDFCTSVDIDRAIAVTVDSFVGSQKISCKKALARAFAKCVLSILWLLLRADFLPRYTLRRPEAQRRDRGGARNSNAVGTVAA